MAEFFYIPEWSPMTSVATHLVTNMVSSAYSKFKHVFCWTLAHVWTPIFQLVVLMTPRYSAELVLLWFWGIFHASAWVVWWTMYLSSRWRYLSVRGRTLLCILRDPDHKKSLHKARYEKVPDIRLVDTRLTNILRERDINRNFTRFHDTWCDTVNEFQVFRPKTRNKLRI